MATPRAQWLGGVLSNIGSMGWRRLEIWRHGLHTAPSIMTQSLQTIVLASNNAGKLAELQELFGTLGVILIT